MSEIPPDHEAVERVQALMDDPESLFRLIYTGEDENVHYYIAVIVRDHEGERYLNERYVSLQKDDDSEYDDTFRKNGINRRFDSVGLADALRDVYQSVLNIGVEKDPEFFDHYSPRVDDRLEG